MTVVGGLALAVVLYEKIFHQSGSLTSALQQVHTNNSNTKSLTFGSSNIPYSSNPLYYPRDIYTVMFDPLPVTAHGKSELLAGMENLVILGIILGFAASTPLHDQSLQASTICSAVPHLLGPFHVRLRGARAISD